MHCRKTPSCLDDNHNYSYIPFFHTVREFTLCRTVCEQRTLLHVYRQKHQSSGIAPASLISHSHWKWLGDHGNKNAFLHLLQEGGGRDNAPSDRQYSPYTRLSVAWRADVRFSRLRSTCWSNANFMMKSDTDFICRVLCKTSESINPAAYLLFWHSVAVSGLRSPLILPCLYAL